VGLTLRQRVASELLILAALSTGFLVLFPRRPIAVDMGLALFALGLVLLTAKHTSSAIWGPVPVESTGTRWQRCVASTMIPTALAMSLFLLMGVSIAYEAAGWLAVWYRIVNPRIPTAVALYFPWALLQQTLFQFYLLGRMRVLWPSLHPLSYSALNGLAFGFAHSPDLWMALMAWLGGTMWSFLYLRYRLLWPLALSHALLGTTLYYWVYARDLAGPWLTLLSRWL
jgi:hypothetical protein